jgi:hypothetical protein
MVLESMALLLLLAAQSDQNAEHVHACAWLLLLLLLNRCLLNRFVCVGLGSLLLCPPEALSLRFCWGKNWGVSYLVFSICCLIFAAELESEVLLTLRFPAVTFRVQASRANMLPMATATSTQLYWV